MDGNNICYASFSRSRLIWIYAIPYEHWICHDYQRWCRVCLLNNDSLAPESTKVFPMISHLSYCSVIYRVNLIECVHKWNEMKCNMECLWWFCFFLLYCCILINYKVINENHSRLYKQWLNCYQFFVFLNGMKFNCRKLTTDVTDVKLFSRNE